MNKFEQAAIASKKENGYFRTFKINQHLCAWIRYQAQCVYCKADLLSSAEVLFGAACTDHLLPKAIYPELVAAYLNGVPCCHRCNWLKGRWDANRDEPLYLAGSGELSESAHVEFVKRARDYVESRSQVSRQEFDSIKQAWARIANDWDRFDDKTFKDHIGSGSQ